jgi:hypothetical protein
MRVRDPQGMSYMRLTEWIGQESTEKGGQIIEYRGRRE